MPTTGQRYAVGIGTGAASGAAAGSALGPWGALIGGAIGAGGGAVSAAMGASEEAKQRALMEEQEKRKKRAILMNLLRNQAAAAGFDTTQLDTQNAENDLDYQTLQDNRAFTTAHRIDPASFAPIAAAGTQAAGRVYNGLNSPSLQLQPMQSQPTAAPGDYQLDTPRLLQDDEYGLDPKRYSLSGGFR